MRLLCAASNNSDTVQMNFIKFDNVCVIYSNIQMEMKVSRWLLGTDKGYCAYRLMLGYTATKKKFRDAAFRWVYKFFTPYKTASKLIVCVWRQ
jgi:hypothetical protein